jgi:hypothetical protein
MIGGSTSYSGAHRKLRKRRRWLGGLAIVLVWPILSSVARPLRAEQALTPLDTNLADSVLEQRLRFLEQKLEDSRTHGQIWYWSWMSIDVGSMVALGIDAGLTKHEDDAVNSGVNAGLAAIGIADLLFRPLEAGHGADPISIFGAQTREQKIGKLRAAEDLLRRNAERAEERTSMTMHAANLAVNGAAGLVVCLAGRTSDGMITFAVGTLGGVINLLTAPWRPERDWNDYKALVAGRRDTGSADLIIEPTRDGARLALRVAW